MSGYVLFVVVLGNMMFDDCGGAFVLSGGFYLMVILF